MTPKKQNKPSNGNPSPGDPAGADNVPDSAAPIKSSGEVSVRLALTVGKSQRVVLLLNEFTPDKNSPAKAYSFTAWKRDEDTDSITISTNGVEPGDYLMRLQVDGAESPLEVDTDKNSPTFERYIGPRVVIE